MRLGRAPPGLPSHTAHVHILLHAFNALPGRTATPAFGSAPPRLAARFSLLPAPVPAEGRRWVARSAAVALKASMEGPPPPDALPPARRLDARRLLAVVEVCSPP